MKAEIETKLENKVEQFHLSRGNCICPELDGLWKYMQEVDKLALECTGYAKSYIKDREGKEKDRSFMDSFTNVMNQWDQSLENYRELYLQNLKADNIVLKKGSRAISINQFLEESEDNKAYSSYCATCDTLIPRIEYGNWGPKR